MTAERWSAHFSVSWQPILTFARRRLELLDWLEMNANVVGFSEDEDFVGVAIDSSETRLTVDRRHLEIQIGPASDASSLAGALGGVWSIMNPHEIIEAEYIGAWSAPLATDYDEARSALARRVCGFGHDEVGFTPVDFSALVDFERADFEGQLEFGVVNPQELRFRLSEPTYGRLADRLIGSAGPHGPGLRPRISVRVEDLPPASLFVDILLSRIPSTDPAGPEQVLAAFARAEAEAEAMAESLDRCV